MCSDFWRLQHFISRASDEIQNLFILQVTTIDEFQQVVQYFGENPREITSAEWFNNFAIFVTKFEVNTFSRRVFTVQFLNWSAAGLIALIIFFNKQLVKPDQS